MLNNQDEVMPLCVQILVPSIPRITGTVYFRGYLFVNKLRVTIYITKFSKNDSIVTEKSCNEDENIIFGLCVNKSRTSGTNKLRTIKNLIIFNWLHELQVQELILDGNLYDVKDNYVVVLYDYNKIHESEVQWEYCDELSRLQHLILSEHSMPGRNQPCSVSMHECPVWLSSSMFIQHVINFYNITKWLVFTIKTNKKVSIKQGNLIFAFLMDILLGYIILEYLTQDTKELSSILMGVLEKLINLLYSLLKWLMGAPAGLKLNNAFNKMLGKYFSYHVQLWWLFLDVSGEKLDMILHLFYYLGYLGFTFQAAMIADMICIATFHSYCIYVYAARMFNIQISGLIALLRFFVGRKYNPLRKGIDSCEYTNQELFVGTVAFTILLLLLPTTLMYYIVFTVFRVLSILVQYVLAKLIYLIHTFPLFVVALWLIRSPRVAGNVLLEVVNRDKKSSPLTIRLRLLNKSLLYLVNNFKPPVNEPKPVVWTSFFTNIFSGKQVI